MREETSKTKFAQSKIQKIKYWSEKKTKTKNQGLTSLQKWDCLWGLGNKLAIRTARIFELNFTEEPESRRQGVAFCKEHWGPAQLLERKVSPTGPDIG